MWLGKNAQHSQAVLFQKLLHAPWSVGSLSASDLYGYLKHVFLSLLV